MSFLPRKITVPLALSTGCTAVLALAGPAMACTPGGGHSGSHAGGAASVRADVVPFTTATVSDPTGGKLTVKWTAPGVKSVTVYAGSKTDHLTKRVGAGRGDGTLTVTAPADSTREFFKLVPDRGEALVVSERDLGLASDPNLRDVGEYRTANGQWVRAGVIYRSAALTLSPADAAVVNTLGIKQDFDLRTTAEIAAAPDVVPTGATYRNLNVIGSSSAAVLAFTDAAAAQQLMIEGEQQFVLSDPAKSAYHDLFTGIANNPTGASLYHCTAGKDRTGWASAVLLTLLGVPQDVVVNDYLLSNTYYFNSPAVQATLSALPPATAAIYQHLLDVEPTYLQAGFDQVTTTYGTMSNYAVHGLGLSPATLAKLRAKLLVGAPTRPRK